MSFKTQNNKGLSAKSNTNNRQIADMHKGLKFLANLAPRE
jgi:cell division protein FtsB